MPEPDECPYELQMQDFAAGLPLWARAQSLWDKAKDASQQGEFELAVSLLTEFLDLPVETGWRLDARLNRGRCLMNLERDPEALADFNKVVDQGSVASEQTRRARTMSAAVHLQMGDRTRAIAALEAALGSKDPALSDELRERIRACIEDLRQSERAAGTDTDSRARSTRDRPVTEPGSGEPCAGDFGA